MCRDLRSCHCCQTRPTFHSTQSRLRAHESSWQLLDGPDSELCGFLGWAEVGGAGIAGRHLARRQPQGPLAGVVLGEDGEHALHRAQDGAMQNDRLLQRLVLRAVLEVKPARGRNQL